MMEDLLIKLALAGVVFFGVLNLAGLHTWVERKQSALIQDRIGANRADIFGFRALGLFHALADAVKMFTKEDIVPGPRGQNPPHVGPLLLGLLRPGGIRRDPLWGPPHSRGRTRH